jgi:hypothetical protein
MKNIFAKLSLAAAALIAVFITAPVAHAQGGCITFPTPSEYQQGVGTNVYRVAAGINASGGPVTTTPIYTDLTLATTVTQPATVPTPAGAPITICAPVGAYTVQFNTTLGGGGFFNYNINIPFPGAVGAYQGVASVSIIDTAFHALIAAGSDVLIPANFLNAAGKKVRVHGSGVYTTGAASLLNARVDLCTISGCATGTDFAAAGCAVVTTNQANVLSNGQFSIDCAFTTTSTLGASGTLMAKALVCAQLGSATSAVQSCFQDTVLAVSAAVDETVNEFVNISFKFSTSNAANTAILNEMTVELVK